MSQETLHDKFIPEVPDTVPEEFVVLVEFQRASEILLKVQQEGIAEKDRTDPLVQLNPKTGEPVISDKQQPLSLFDRVITFEDAGVSRPWRLTAIEMNSSSYYTNTTSDSVTYPELGETQISHYVYRGPNVFDPSLVGDLNIPDEYKTRGRNSGFGIILTDGERVLCNYPRLVDGKIILPKLYIEGISSTIPAAPGGLVGNGAVESVKIDMVEQMDSGQRLKHGVAFDRGSNGAYIFLNTENGSLPRGSAQDPDQSRQMNEAYQASLLAEHPKLMSEILARTGS